MHRKNELGLRRMVAVDDGDPDTTALVSAFGNAFGALGGEIAVATRINKGDTDMTEVLAEFAAAEPDGIFFPLFEEEGTPFAEQARAFDGLEDATLITGAALLVSEFLGTPQSEGMYFAGPESPHGYEHHRHRAVASRAGPDAERGILGSAADVPDCHPRAR